MQYYKVPASLFQAMANYLSHQPYRDVATMLDATKGLTLINEAEEAKGDPEEPSATE